MRNFGRYFLTLWLLFFSQLLLAQISSTGEIMSSKMLNGKLVIKDCDLCPEMIKIRQGSFLMGGNDDLESEKPQRSVKIKKSFYIGRYEITQKQWKFISGQLPVKMEFTKCGGGLSGRKCELERCARVY